MYFFSASVYYWPAWETINTNQICVPCAEDIIDGDFFKDSCRLCFTYYGANILSISCTKLVISCKASIFFSHARLHSSIFSPYCDSFWHKLSQYGKKNTVYLCIPYSLLPGEIWSLVWDHWFRAWDAQCMCTIRIPKNKTHYQSAHSQLQDLLSTCYLVLLFNYYFLLIVKYMTIISSCYLLLLLYWLFNYCFLLTVEYKIVI